MKKMSFLPAVLASLIGFSADAKKTVCSITINSSDEIVAFKNSLSPKEFDFIELTNKNDGDWFNSSCRSKIQCDVLLVSGHFGGTFFGESGFALSMKELEEASCKSDCSGILKKPKEVYLFGCNTLAGKNTDHRTPEQYVQILLNDGFSPAAAQQVAAFRYSPIGSTFSNRMAHVFNKTPRIYGFNSVSPLGKYTGPLAKKYLSTVAEKFSNLLDDNSTANNTALLKIFSGTSIVQEKGKGLESDEMSPVCYLSTDNTSSSRAEKLMWIADAFERSANLENVVYVADFLKNEAWNKKWNNQEKEILRRITENSALKEQLDLVLNSEKGWLRRTQAEVLQLFKAIGWFTESDYNSKITQILNLNKIDFSYDDMIFVCTMKIQANLNLSDLKNVDWKNQNFKYAISCLNSKNPTIWNKLNEN